MDNPCKSYTQLEWKEALKQGREPEEIVVQVKDEIYNSCMLNTESDHKPVYSLLSLNVPIMDQERKRERLFSIMSIHQKLCSKQHESVMIDNSVANGIKLAFNPKTKVSEASFWLLNQGKAPLLFQVMGQKNVGKDHDTQTYEPSYVLAHRLFSQVPSWLYVTPQIQLINPNERVTITVNQIAHCKYPVPIKSKISIRFGEEHMIGKETQDNNQKCMEFEVTKLRGG